MTTRQARNRDAWAGNAIMLTGSTVLIGIANYVLSLLVVHVLAPRQFDHFAAAQGLLVVVGTGSLSAVPWAQARYIAREPGPSASRQAMYFGTRAAGAQSVVLGAVGLAVGCALDGWFFGAVLGLAAAVISVMASPIGVLQGEARLAQIAATRSIETAVRLVASIVLVLVVRRSATAAVLGFPIGSAVAVGYAFASCRHCFPTEPVDRRVAARLMKDALSLGAIQMLLTMLGALDTVYADSSSLSARATGSYQAGTLLARVPLYLSGSLSTACYTSLVGATDEAATGKVLRRALGAYAWVEVAAALVCTTVPLTLLHLFVPSSYGGAAAVLRVAWLGGLSIGAINIITTAHQARGRYRSCTYVLAAGVLGQGIVLEVIGHVAGAVGFTVAASAVAGGVLVLIGRDGWRWLAGWRVHLHWELPAIVLTAAVMYWMRQPLLWALAAIVTAAIGAKGAMKAMNWNNLDLRGSAPQCKTMPVADSLATGLRE